jgi:F-type H+-transporting ATPase subunit delta
MAELATIARPYAEALFKATQSDMAATAQWLNELAQVASHAQLLQFADNPKVTPEKVLELVSSLVKSKASPVAQNFLRTVIDNGRMAALPEVAAQYRAHLNALGGSSDALVYSAFEIDAAALADLGAVLQKRFGRKLNLTVKLEPELIGGIRVVVGDEVLDTSVKARLDQMKVSLTA